MGKEFLKFGNAEVEKKRNLPYNCCFLEDVDIEKVLVSNKICFSEKSCKCFIGYLYNGKSNL